MGFGASDLKFLLSAKKIGAVGKSICTLGHLTLHMSQRELNAILANFGERAISLPSDRAIIFADDVLGPLGFETIYSVDASDYEKANLIFDLNSPIPQHMHEKYDVVWDGGTLEHVFNFPTAMESAMHMLKIGGNMFSQTPANNQCGHGFYQFSPELFFRLFSSENGFELIRIYLNCGGKQFHIKDPAIVHGRVELLNSDGAFVMIHARKIGAAPKRIKVQQSDYISAWADHVTDRKDGSIKAAMRKIMSPVAIARTSKILNKIRQSRNVRQWKRNSKLSNRKFYLPVSRWDEPTAIAISKRGQA